MPIEVRGKINLIFFFKVMQKHYSYFKSPRYNEVFS